MAYTLPGTELLTVKLISSNNNESVFDIEPLLPGYGMTIGNALRRTLLNSIEGAAPTAMRIEGATHEFTVVDGVKEDLVEITLNVKQISVKSFATEPVQLILEKKGPGVVTTGDFKSNSLVEFVDPSQVICTLDKNGKLSMELTVERGIGYRPVEMSDSERHALGTIALDSNFGPVTKVNFEVSNTRVGQRTDYDKVTMTLATNGSVSPEDALQTAAKILVEQFGIIAGIREAVEVEAVAAVADNEGLEVAESELNPEKPKKVRASKKTATPEAE